MPGEEGGVAVAGYSCAHGGQIYFGDLTPYLIYAVLPRKATRTMTIEF
jgi:hypothetical protein